MITACYSGEYPGPCSWAAVGYHHHHWAGYQPGPSQGWPTGKSEGAASWTRGSGKACACPPSFQPNKASASGCFFQKLHRLLDPLTF